MSTTFRLLGSLCAALLPWVILVLTSCSTPHLPGVRPALQAAVDRGEVVGAVAVVVTRDRVVDLDTAGFADRARKKPMRADTVCSIASMTKPITATAILMLQDDGKLKVSDPVAKYIPGFADLKTPSGRPAGLTIAQLLTHTSGLGEAPLEKIWAARTLAGAVPLFLAAPMQYEPGTKWKYTQSGINVAARIVEIAGGMSFDEFTQKRIFDPLGMKSTTFYPMERFPGRLAVSYTKNTNSGALEVNVPSPGYGTHDRPPLGNSGLFSTGPDYARFCQMLLGQGVFRGKRYLSPEAFHLMSTIQTGDLPTGFFQTSKLGRHGANYGWGIGTCILRTPHEGAAAMLSPGTFGHGGAWGTQAWVDPVRGVAYVLMVQRTNFEMSDASEIRRDFQQAASDALPR
jgi:CubicO group peptidase (beta-lactamase class C family)